MKGGASPPQARAFFAVPRFQTELRGWLAVGNAKDVIAKILYQHQFFGHQRFLLQMPVGPTPHEAAMRSIGLFAKDVAPALREEVARRAVKDNGHLLR